MAAEPVAILIESFSVVVNINGVVVFSGAPNADAYTVPTGKKLTLRSTGCFFSFGTSGGGQRIVTFRSADSPSDQYSRPSIAVLTEGMVIRGSVSTASGAATGYLEDE